MTAIPVACVTLERDGRIVYVTLRQGPTDIRAQVGGKLKWGSGKRWTVLEVAPMGEAA